MLFVEKFCKLFDLKYPIRLNKLYTCFKCTNKFYDFYFLFILCNKFIISSLNEYIHMYVYI